MINTSTEYKNEIKQNSRMFECEVTIGDRVFSNEDIVDIKITSNMQPNEGFSIGTVTSQQLELTLLNRSETIYSMNQIKVEIGLKIGNDIEYLLMGLYNIDDIEKTDYTIKFTAYDNMIKFETPYFSKLGNKATLQQIVNELSAITGVEFTGSLPTYNLKKLEGFTCREVLGYVASLCAGNAAIKRDGSFTIVSPKEINYTIDAGNYIDYKREDVVYKIGKVSCQVGENIISKGALGTDSMELEFENPWIDDKNINDVYNKLKGFTYLGYTMKWQGDISLDIGDIATLIDKNNIERKIPIFSQSFTYTGGLTSDLSAKGETKNKNSFSSNGNTNNKINRVVTELLIVNEALINKANIQDLQAINAEIYNLKVSNAEIENAIIKFATIERVEANYAELKKLIAGSATITDLNAAVGKIEVLITKTADIEHLLAGNITADNIQVGTITAESGIIVNGAIGDAQISSLSANKIKTGSLDTSLVTIASADGIIQITGNQILVNKNNSNRVILGEYIKTDGTTDYGLLVRGKDNQTVMIDGNGVHNAGLTSDAIKDNVVADNANIMGHKLNINSVIREVNENGTETIKGTKVQVGDRTLDVELSTQKNAITEQEKELSSQKLTIQAMDNSLKLKVDEQKFTQSIDGLNTNLSKATTDIGLIKGELSTKVSQVDINKTISEAKGRNLVLNSLIETTSSEYAFAIRDTVDLEKGKEYTVIFNGHVDQMTIDTDKSLTVYIWDDTWQSSASASTIALDDTTVSFKFTANVDGIHHISSYLFPMGGNREGKVTINWYKLVEGDNVILDWAPAPEDTNNAILDSYKKTDEKISTVETELKETKDSFNFSINDLNNKTSTIETNIVTATKELNNKIDIEKENAVNEARHIKDTRNDNQNPEWYFENYPFQTITEFKSSDIIDLLNVENTFGVLETKVPWDNSSGGYPTQTFRSSGIPTYQRSGVNTTTWSEWIQIEDAISSQNKADEAKQQAIENSQEYTNTQVKVVNTEVKNNTTQLNLLKNEINTKVSQSEIDKTVVEINNKIETTTEKISTVESTFTQKTNNINATVSDVQSILSTKADGSTVTSIQGQLVSLNIGVEGIKHEVSKKVDEGSIISAINQSAEEITIDASRIKLNGLTTFASETGLKAIEIESNNIIFYDWEGSERKEAIGQIYSTRTSGDSRKPGIAIGNKKGASFDIVYETEDMYQPYMTFDKDNVLGNKVPITINQDIALNASSLWLSTSKKNDIFESQSGDFCIEAKHGIQITDMDTKKITSLLGSDRAAFAKWNQNYYYAEFFPGGFTFASGNGNKYFWADAGSSDIRTKKGVNMRIGGSLSVDGAKNRIVETEYGDLALNAVESTECWFEDIIIEENQTDINGDCIVRFDNKFLATVNTTCKYKVDVTPIGEFASDGKVTYVRVVEKAERYFRVRGTPNTLFDWTISAKQKGYERDRLEVMEKTEEAQSSLIT